MRARKSQRSIRYVLHVDKALRRISLRRMSMREKKEDAPSPRNRARKSVARQTRSKKVSAAKPSRSLLSRDPWWMAFGVVCVAGIVLLIGVPRSAERARSTSEPAQTTDKETQDAAESVSLETSKRVSKAAVASDAGRAPKIAASTTSRVAERPAKPPVERTASANTSPNATGQTSTPATIQGCLQAGNEGFWLRDTSGADAPASRNWRTGFLKKRSSSIEVIDASDSLGLANYLGQRVAATGSLTNRRLQLHSINRVTGSCG